MSLAGLLAVMTLVRLMLRRQEQLRGLLRTYVDGQMDWARKKTRAALMARRAANQMSDDNDLSQLTQILHQDQTDTNSSPSPDHQESVIKQA